MYHICNNTESEVQFQCPKCDFVHDRRQFMKHHKQVHGEYPPGFEDIKKFHCEYCPEVRAYTVVEIFSMMTLMQFHSKADKIQ